MRSPFEITVGYLKINIDFNRFHIKKWLDFLVS